MANTDGGHIIVGVDDKKTAPEISRCPYPHLTVPVIRKWIWDLTKPPVECKIARLDEIVPNLAGSPQGDLFVIKVKKRSIQAATVRIEELVFSGWIRNAGPSILRSRTTTRDWPWRT